MYVDNAIPHCRLKLVHERIWHHCRRRAAASELWHGVVASGTWRNIFVFNLLRAIIIVQIGHLKACLLAEVAHVTVGAEGEIVVVAPFAHPVTGSLMRSLLLFFCRQRHSCEPSFQWFPRSLGCIEGRFCSLDPLGGRGRGQISVNLQILKFTVLLHLDPLQLQTGRGILRLITLQQVKGLARQILLCSYLLASVAFFSALEIVVLALRAFPSTIWELEGSLSFFGLLFFIFTRCYLLLRKSIVLLLFLVILYFHFKAL